MPLAAHVHSPPVPTRPHPHHRDVEAWATSEIATSSTDVLMKSRTSHRKPGLSKEAAGQVDERTTGRRRIRRRAVSSGPRVGQTTQTCMGGTEPARLVERTEPRFEVNVQPLAASRDELDAKRLDESSSHPSALVVRIHCRIEDECMCSAVTAGMHEADEPLAIEGADPADGMSPEPRGPRQDRRLGVAEGLCMETTQLDVIDREGRLVPQQRWSHPEISPGNSAHT